MQPVLEIRGFSRRDLSRVGSLLDWMRRRGRPYLEIPHLRLEVGRVYAVIGRSGAGKSVLNSLLMERPASRNVPSRRERAAWTRPTICLYLPQLLPDASGYDMGAWEYFLQISLALSEICGVPPMKSADYGTWLEEHDEIRSFKEGGRKLKVLSGGERRRLELQARLLALTRLQEGEAGARSLLILDEPTTGFDWKAQEDFLKSLRGELRKAPGLTILVTTHALDKLWDEDVFDGVVFVKKDAPAAGRGSACCRVSRAFARRDVVAAVARREGGARGTAASSQLLMDLCDLHPEALEKEIGGGRDGDR